MLQYKVKLFGKKREIQNANEATITKRQACSMPHPQQRVVGRRVDGASQVVQAVVKNPLASTGNRRHRFDPWVGKTSWGRK